MSMSMKVAKAGYQGDPGLFGFIGKALGTVARGVGSILPGPAGMVAKAVGGVLAPSRPAALPTMRPTVGTVVTTVRPGFVQTAGAIPPQVTLPGGRTLSLQGTTIVSGPTSAAGQTGPMTGPLLGGKPSAGATCERGYHYNRTGYHTKRYGYIEPGTVCVKNRKRNPLNPKALSRALARTASAKKAIKALKIFDQVRPRRSWPAAASNGRKKACGCR